MKTVNLDKFRKQTAVTINGKEYIVKGMTVGQYINDDFDNKFKNAKTDKEKVKVMIGTLTKISNIPEEVLYDLDFDSLLILSQIAQGVDIEDEVESEENKKK